jgi:hypothetical protein
MFATRPRSRIQTRRAFFDPRKTNHRERAPVGRHCASFQRLLWMLRAEQVLPVIHKFFKPVDWHSRNPVGAHSTTNNFADKLGPSEHPPIQRRSLKDCIVVGDSVWDLLGARRANALGIGLLCGAYGEAELYQAGAYRVYENPANLFDHIGEIGIRLN